MSAEIACAEMDALLAERASGALPAGERSRLDAHLVGCERCRAELARYEDAFAILRGPPDALAAGEGDPGLGPATLRLWKRTRRRRALAAAGLAAAAAAALALAPGLLARRSAEPVKGDAQLAAWEPDVDGALEASGLRRRVSSQSDLAQESDLGQDEESTEVDVVLAAFDAADQP